MRKKDWFSASKQASKQAEFKRIIAQKLVLSQSPQDCRRWCNYRAEWNSTCSWIVMSITNRSYIEHTHTHTQSFEQFYTEYTIKQREFLDKFGLLIWSSCLHLQELHKLSRKKIQETTCGHLLLQLSLADVTNAAASSAAAVLCYVVLGGKDSRWSS